MKQLIYLMIIGIVLVGCTLSMVNISNEGTASDMVDEEQAASPNVSATIQVPAM